VSPTEPLHAYNSASPEEHEMRERRVDAKADIERMGFAVYNGKSQQDAR
jgi:hypothetical protein